MHQPDKHEEGCMEDLLLLIYILCCSSVLLQPQWTSSFQLTTIAGSYGNPSQLQVQIRVSNIWKVLLRRLGSFLSAAAEEGSMLCGTPTWDNGRQPKRLYKQMYSWDLSCPIGHQMFPGI